MHISIMAHTIRLVDLAIINVFTEYALLNYSFSRQGTDIILNGVWYYKHSEKFGSASG